jgi:diacylglycerol kinase (ATP)
VSSQRVVFVVNPNAGNGAAGRQWPGIRAKARDRLGAFQTHMTTGPGHAVRLAREAASSGANILVCVGGDGTLNEVVNGLMNDGEAVSSEFLLGYFPRGTGCDLGRTAPIPRDTHQALDNILNRRTRRIDVGRFVCRNHVGAASCLYFHNVLSFGLGGEVDERVNRTTKAFGGFISFIWGTLISILLYDRKRIYMAVDDQFDDEVTAWNVAVANGQFHGGGMWVAPGADLSDGVFHLTVIGNLSFREIFSNLHKLYTGKIYEVDKVKTLTGRRVVATSPQRVLIDMDGEQPGRLPVAVDIIPSALNLISS